MRNICIVCEGPTETEFVTKCLTPHLIAYGVYPHARILQAPSGRHRGGRVSVERLVQHLSHEYRSYDRLTTLVDFYGFQDRNGRSRAQLEQSILEGVQASTTGFDARFILPYVQMHEFEALLFSDVTQFEWVQDGWSPQAETQLQSVRNAFANPEEINNSPQTAPSKRLLAILGEENYSKVEHGPLVAEAIGLAEIRRQCPQFHEWLTALEAWGN